MFGAGGGIVLVTPAKGPSRLSERIERLENHWVVRLLRILGITAALVVAVVTIVALVRSIANTKTVSTASLEQLSIGLSKDRFTDILGQQPTDATQGATIFRFVPDRRGEADNSRYITYFWEHPKYRVVATTDGNVGSVVAFSVEIKDESLTPKIPVLGGRLGKSSFASVASVAATSRVILAPASGIPSYEETFAAIGAAEQNGGSGGKEVSAVTLTAGGGSKTDPPVPPDVTPPSQNNSRAPEDLYNAIGYLAGDLPDCEVSESACGRSSSPALEAFRSKYVPTQFAVVGDR